MRWLAALTVLFLMTAGGCSGQTVPAASSPVDHVSTPLPSFPDDIPGIDDLPGRQPIVNAPDWDTPLGSPANALQMAAPPVPMVAIIIDDMGFDTDGGRLLLNLDYPLTFAVLPLAPRAVEQAVRAAERGCEVIVHLPMEPIGRGSPDGGTWQPDPGPGAIVCGMEPDQIHQLVKAHFEAVPGVIGANNHMGSAATADAEVMAAVMRAVREAGGLFVDSMTTPASVARAAARTEGVRFAASSLFLDNVIDVEVISRQLRLLGELALRDGTAIAIGHPHVATAQALERVLPELEQAGVRIVGISALVAVPIGGGNDD